MKTMFSPGKTPRTDPMPDDLEPVSVLVNSLEDMGFALDRQQRYVRVFGRWLKKYGLRADAFLGKTAREVLGAEAATVHEEANERVLRGEEEVYYEWAFPQPQGTRFFQTSLSTVRGARRHRAEAGRGGLAKGEGGSRDGQPGQERLPRQHEPRNPHADDGHSRV